MWDLIPVTLDMGLEANIFRGDFLQHQEPPLVVELADDGSGVAAEVLADDDRVRFKPKIDAAFAEMRAHMKANQYDGQRLQRQEVYDEMSDRTYGNASDRPTRPLDRPRTWLKLTA